MGTTVTSTDELDCDISIAFLALGVARRSWDRCPSAENAGVVDRAEAALNSLLERRFAAQR